MPRKNIVDFANQVKSYALGIKDQQVLGAWNLMPMTLSSQSINGLTVTVDSDKVIDINGTASEQTILILKRKIGTLIPGKTYYLSGITGGSLNTYFMTYNNDSESLYYINLYDGFGEFTAVDESTCPNTFVALYIRSGVTMNHVKVKPMISLEPNQSYVPHAMTNKELTDVVDITSEFEWESGITKRADWSKIIKRGKTINGQLRFTLPDTVTMNKPIMSVPSKYAPVVGKLLNNPNIAYTLGSLNNQWDGTSKGLLNWLNGNFVLSDTAWTASANVIISFSYEIE